MKFYDLWPYVAVFPFLSSIVFFVLARDKTWVERSFASVHGWASLSILAFSAYIASHHPNLKVIVGIPGIFVLGGVSAVSIFYAVATLRVRWLYQLLHIPTVFIIATGFLASLFALAEAH